MNSSTLQQTADLKQPNPQMPEADAARLLQSLEAELASSRAQRMSGDNRAAFRIWSLVFIVGGAIAALCVLQFMLSQIAAERGVLRLNGMTLLNQEVRDFVLDCDAIDAGQPSPVPGDAPRRKYLVGGLPRVRVAQIDAAFPQSRASLNAVQLAPVCTFNAFEF